MRFSLIIFLVFFSCQNNQNSKQVKGGTITIQKFDTPAPEIEISLSEEKGFGLDLSNVTVEKFPLIVAPVTNLKLRRVEN